MKIRFLSLTLFLSFASVMWACQDDDDFGEKCPPVDPYFRIVDIRSYNLKVLGYGGNPWTGISDEDQVYWWNYFIRFGFESEYIAVGKKDPNSRLMALSCLPTGYKGDKVGVDTLYLTTVSDYNEQFAAGDTLNQAVLMQNWTSSRDKFEDFFPISDYLEENREGIKREIFEMKLEEGPEEAGEYTFELIYVLNNGEVFSHTTDPVFLRN